MSATLCSGERQRRSAGRASTATHTQVAPCASKASVVAHADCYEVDAVPTKAAEGLDAARPTFHQWPKAVAGNREGKVQAPLKAAARPAVSLTGLGAPANHGTLCKCGVNFCRAQRRECNTCRNRRFDHPLLRLYRNLKAHAKARGKVFALDRDRFVRWIVDNNYAIFHGRHKKRLHIDRIRASEGYVWGNVQILACSDNCKKRWTDARASA